MSTMPREAFGVGEAVSEPVGVAVRVEVALALGEGVALVLALAVRLRVRVVEGVALTESVEPGGPRAAPWEAVTQAVPVGLGVQLLLFVLLALPGTVAVGVSVAREGEGGAEPVPGKRCPPLPPNTLSPPCVGDMV